MLGSTPGSPVKVSGSDVRVTVTFAKVYNVAFMESGLPSGSVWAVVINGTLYFTPAGSAISTNLPNGTWPYVIQDVAGWHQTTLPYAGTVTVTGAPVNEPTIVFVQVTYAVTFSESGLPRGTWTVTVNGTAFTEPVGTSIVSRLPNGSFTYAIGEYAGYQQQTLPPSGTGSVQGAPVTEPTLVFTRLAYTVTFTETGLASGTIWTVTFNGSTRGGTAPSSVAFVNVQNGTYPFSVAAITGYTSTPSSGSISVSGTSVTKGITFTSTGPALYAVTFTESGLPSGNWNVTVNGTVHTEPVGTSVVAQLPNGTFTYVIHDYAGYHQGTLPYSGTGSIDGAAITEPTLLFTPVTYTVTFTESGLASGTTWTVILNGTAQSEPAPSSVTFVGVGNGTYPFSVGTVTGYTSTPSSGSITASGTSVTEGVTFTSTGPTQYPVTFTESGLPSGTTWSVTVGTATGSSPTQNIVVTLVNGTYPYKVVASLPWYPIQAGSGSVTVAGAPVSLSVTFAFVSQVTIEQTGIPTGTPWMVQVTLTPGTPVTGAPGSTGMSWFANETGPTAVFPLVNGTYSYVITASGYQTATGTFPVKGQAEPVPVTVSPNSSSSGLAWWVWVIVGVAIAAVLIVVVVVLMRRRGGNGPGPS